jgi:putative endonuclease
MADRRGAVARLGEDAAAQYLAGAGYTVLDRNYRCAAGEVDVVAREGNVIVFAEVRARSGPTFGTPEDSVTKAKAGKMAACAMTYLAARPARHSSWRVDFIAVDVRAGRVAQIRHLKNALQ